jgi:hypothetical protein
MVGLLCAVWALLFSLTVYAFWRGEIFLAKEEDVVKDKMGLPDIEKGNSEKSGHGHHH